MGILKIEKREKLCVFGIDALPFEIITTTLYGYDLVEVRLSHKEAVDMAFSRLREELDIALNNAELITKSVKTDYDSEGVYITCQLYCLENIAKVQEFYTEK